MTDRRDAAMTRLKTRLADNAGRDVVYTRGVTEITITGVITDPKSDSPEAALGVAAGLDLSGLDLIIAVADLGALGLPEQGDTIRTTIGGVEHEFSTRRDTGEDVYRFTDPMRTMARVHLAHIGEVT